MGGYEKLESIDFLSFWFGGRRGRVITHRPWPKICRHFLTSDYFYEVLEVVTQFSS